MTKQHPEKIDIISKKKRLQMHISAVAKCDVFQVYFVLIRIWDSNTYDFVKHSSNIQSCLSTRVSYPVGFCC